MKNRTSACTVTVYESDFVLPTDLTEIEEEAFEGIDAGFVYVPDNCEKIGAHAFRDSNIRQIRIPADCEIGDDILAGCEDVMVFGTAGSEAEQYARDHGNRFIEEN